MRINIWIVLVVLIALLAVTRLSRCQQDTQHIGVRAVSFVLAHFGSYRLTMYLLPKQHAALPVSAAVIAVTGYPSSRPLFFERLTRGTGARMLSPLDQTAPFAGILTGAGIVSG